VRIENDTSWFSATDEEGYMTNINEPLISCPMPTAAHPVPGAGKRAERCRERSLVSVVLLCDEVRAKQRSVVLEGLRWQNCVEGEGTNDADEPLKIARRSSGDRIVDHEPFMMIGYLGEG
jgi:hypothetical protein